MIEALGAGEWWRGSRDKWFGDCTRRRPRRLRKTFVHRIVADRLSAPAGAGARVFQRR